MQQQHVATRTDTGDPPRVVVALVVALICVASVAWWYALFLLLRWLVGAIF